MNILFLTTHLNAGGITSYLFTMAEGLLRRGHHVSIASSGGDQEVKFLEAGADLLTLNIRTKSELDPRIYLALIPLSRYIREKDIDLIHAQTRITQVMGRWLKKITGKPFLSTCHGFFKTRLSRQWFPCWGDAVIAISRAVEDHLTQDFRIDRQRVFLIESGIDLKAFEPMADCKKQEFREQLHFGKGPVIGLLARLSDVKGQDILIDAMRKVIYRLPEAQLILVGEGKMEGVLRSKARDLNLDDHIHFLLNRIEKEKALALFDVFVSPSRQEGLGLSIMEAQAFGVPVIASRVGGIPSLIEDGKTGILVESEDPEGLASAIIQLLEDPSGRDAIAAAGREFVRKNFSAETMMDKVVQLYEKKISK